MPRKFALAPMEALSVPDLPKGKNWVYEPKWDGFRCIARKNKDKVELISKSGKPLTRYFPDVARMLESLPVSRFILDGELIVMKKDQLSFSELQLRLHPSPKRVEKLASEHPASYVLFDLLLTPDGDDLMKKPFVDRRHALEKFIKPYVKKTPALQLSPQTGSPVSARKWLQSMHGTVDGIVAKNIGDMYHSGERYMQKYKPIRTADCVVGGFRYGTGSKQVGSLLLGLYDDKGKLNHVGFAANIPKADRPALTKKLEKLIKKPGFTGKAPGGPSRWSTDRSALWQPLAPKLIAEVAYDHVSDERFRHGTKFLRWRPDKAPTQCRMDQIT